MTLEELRLNAGLSTRDLADLVDVSHVTIANAERTGRRPQPQNAKKIADYFGLKVTDLWPIEDKTKEGPAALDTLRPVTTRS